MEQELKKRIEELKEYVRVEWNTFEELDIAKEKLERLELLYKDLTEFF